YNFYKGILLQYMNDEYYFKIIHAVLQYRLEVTNRKCGVEMSYKDEYLTYWFKLFVIALIFALIIRKFVFSPIIVDGPSMQPTLVDSDQMIVNKFIYHIKQPDRFDIVIFHAINDKDFIKRVIGLP